MSTGTEQQLVYRDANGADWNTEELQMLVLQVRKFDAVAARLGKPKHEVSKALRSMGVMSPSEFTRHLAKLDPIAFSHLIIREGGQQKAAIYFNISITHLRNVMDEVGIQWRVIKVTPETATAALDRFGSVLLASRLLNTTPAEIKKAAPDWRERRDPLKTGRQAVATGRTGELYWKQLRGENTLEATCEINPNAIGYDFIDREYGKVNVKTANPNKQKNHEIWTWTWEINPEQDAMVFPLILLDHNCKPVGYFLVTRDVNGGLIPPLGCRSVIWGNGSLGISFKAETSRPNLEESNASMDMVLDSGEGANPTREIP